MNVERLHAIVLALREEVRAAGLVKLTRSLAAALESMATQPNQPSHQQQASQQRQALLAAAVASEVDEWPATWQETLRELGVRDLFGGELAAQVEAILGRNEITPSVASEEVTAIAERLAAVETHLNAMTSAFKDLHVGHEELAPGEAEVSVLIPRGAVRENLPDLGAEFRRLNNILGPFVEIVTGSRPPLKVNAIASSDFGLYLETTVQVGAFLAVSIERLLAGYKTLLDIRLARQALAEQGVPAESLGPVDSFADSIMAAKIEEYVDQVVSERLASRANDGRSRELETELRNSLNAIANRIDEGYNFDVRAGEPDAPEEDDRATDEVAESVALIHAAALSLKFINPSGQGILSLPEGPNDVV